MAIPVRIVCIPSADAAFAEDAQRVAARIPEGMSAPDALRWFTLMLRRDYPRAVVREQVDLARTDDGPPTWYVTRGALHFRIDTSIWVPLAPTEAYRAYVERVVDWQVAVELTPLRLAPGTVGTEYRAVYPFLGVRYEGVLRILGAEPGRVVRVEAEGSGITVWYAATFGEERGGALVHVQGDYELPDTLIARVADRLGLERAIGRDVDRANASFRRLCGRIAAARMTPAS